MNTGPVLEMSISDAHVKYANSYCWVKNTYYLEYENHVPRPGEPRDYIRYYQWTAFILVVQVGGQLGNILSEWAQH